jgi:AraC-like DNA-binding protein
MAQLLRSLSLTYSKAHQIDDHEHDWGQLVFALGGAIEVVADQDAWLIPPTKALFVPPLTRHSLRFRSEIALRTIYLPSNSCEALPPKCTGLAVSCLLRELVLEACRIGVLESKSVQHTHLAGLLVSEIARADPLPFFLKLPQDRRALYAAQRILADPGFDWKLSALAHDAGASARTLQRLFLAESKVQFGAWLQLVRIFAACNALLQGGSVTSAALIAGYSSTSGFIESFKRQVGMTPLEYKRLERQR